MKLTPGLVTKDINECTLGEVVYLQNNGEIILCLIAGDPSFASQSIPIIALNGNYPTIKNLDNSNSRIVTSFGSGIIIRVNHRSIARQCEPII
ncbi:hypothetical protein [Blastochloris tepida]|uniref:Uncharacterized protein n=1 Tax=Blastochloris tepida TaxID=2233851 RepID=A0A348FZP9_9HYPH|nr:hypothetical protein [Blastochloris tepida]BBF92782.1 hypothetical protein BLTE_14670 [Blastochloris tepida]